MRASGGKAADFAGIDGFVADKDAESFPAWKLAHHVLVPFVETAHVAGDAGNDAMDQRKWLVFAERNEMNFVVDEDALALRVKEQGAVVRQESTRGNNVGGVHWRFPFDGSYKERMAESNCEGGGDLRELRILKGERSGGFRPDEEVGLFGGRGQADPGDLVELGGMHLKPIRRIGFDFGEIELGGAGEMMRLILRHQAGSSEGYDQENCCCRGCGAKLFARRQRI